jgi:hypothetical protein
MARIRLSDKTSRRSKAANDYKCGKGGANRHFIMSASDGSRAYDRRPLRH